jgi:serine/threonine protein kinase
MSMQGALLYEMLAGETPFTDTNRDVMYRKILTGQVTMKPWFSDEAKELLEGLLRVSV